MRVDKNFTGMINNFRRIHNISVLAIFEPRISGDRAIRITKTLGYSNWFMEEARGFAKGIWLFWNENDVKLHIVHCTN